MLPIARIENALETFTMAMTLERIRMASRKELRHLDLAQ